MADATQETFTDVQPVQPVQKQQPETFTDVAPIAASAKPVKPATVVAPPVTKPAPQAPTTEQGDLATINKGIQGVKNYAGGVANSLGLPENGAEYKAASEDATKITPGKVAQVVGGPAVDLGLQAYGAGKNYLKGLWNTGKEAYEAGQNIAQGQPVMSNLAKPASAYLEANVGAIPFLGQPTVQAGKDIVAGNKAHAAGELTGAIGQLALPEVTDRALPEQGLDFHEKAVESAQKKLDTAKKAAEPYRASLEQGVQPPKKIQGPIDKAQAELDEAIFHRDTHKDAINARRTNVVNPPAAKPAPEVPTAQVEAMPRPGAPKAAATPAAPQNIKLPGQVQPETFPQEPTGKPQMPAGPRQLPGGEPVGKMLQLGEGRPEGPQIPAGGLPKIGEVPAEAPKPAAKFEPGNVKTLKPVEGKVVDKEAVPGTPEHVHKLLQESLKPEVKAATPPPPVAEKPVQAAPAEAPKVEAKAAPVLPKEEAGYTPKKEEVIKTGEEGREQAKSAAEYHPAVQAEVGNLSNSNLDKLATAHGIDPTAPEYSRSKEMRSKATDTSSGRHQIGRDKLAADITEQMSDDEKTNIGRNAERLNTEGTFQNKDMTGKSKAERAESLFPRLRGPVDEAGNPKVSGGSQGADVEAQVKAHEENGGSTFSSEGKDLNGANKYSVGSYPDRTEQVDNLTPKRLSEFKQKNADVLSKEGHAVGTWKDTDTGKSVLDVAKIYSDRNEAIKAGKEVNQKSIYHLGGEGEIQTGGTGDYKNTTKASVDEYSKALKNNPDAASLIKNHGKDMSVEDIAKEMEGRDIIQWVKDGKPQDAFVSIDKDGNISRVVNNAKDAVDSMDLIRAAIKRGGKTIDAWDINGKLPKLYEGLGFEKDKTVPYDVKNYGEPSQDYKDHWKRFGWKEGDKPPDITYMKLKEGAAEPAYTGEERRSTERKAPLNAKETEAAMQNRKPYQNPFDVTEGAKATIESDKNMPKHPAEEAKAPDKAYNYQGEPMSYEQTQDQHHIVTKDGSGKKIGELVAKDSAPGTVEVLSNQVYDKALQGKGRGADQIQHLLNNVGDDTHTVKSDISTSDQARAAWDKVQKFAPDAITKEEFKDGQVQYTADMEKWRGENLPTVSGGSPSAGVGKAKELPELAEKHLTEEEKAGVTKSEAGRKAFVENLKKLPSVQEFTDIAKAGEGGRKWYQRSASAFDALSEEAPKYFKEGDRQKFTDFLASTSPQQSVKMNLGETLNAWTKYVDEGRPTGTALEKLLKDNLTISGSKVPNAMKALAGEPLWPDLSKNSNFKVPSFAKNLTGYLNFVTNDGWQALFGGMDAKKISSATSYHPLAVVTRAAAEALNWSPAEAQAAIWAFTKTFTEHGEIDPKVVRQYSEDFADIMAHDPEIRNQLQQLGVDTEKLDAKLRAIGQKPKITPGASASSGRSVERLANRIETARGKGTIPPPKSGRLGFEDEPDEETRFNPEEFGAAEPLEQPGKKKSPLRMK